MRERITPAHAMLGDKCPIDKAKMGPASGEGESKVKTHQPADGAAAPGQVILGRRHSRFNVSDTQTQLPLLLLAQQVGVRGGQRLVVPMLARGGGVSGGGCHRCGAAGCKETRTYISVMMPVLGAGQQGGRGKRGRTEKPKITEVLFEVLWQYQVSPFA